MKFSSLTVAQSDIMNLLVMLQKNILIMINIANIFNSIARVILSIFTSFELLNYNLAAATHSFLYVCTIYFILFHLMMIFRLPRSFFIVHQTKQHSYVN